MQTYNKLSVREKALVAMAVLLDGREASFYLGSDEKSSQDLKEAAEELSKTAPELRMPLVGSLLRAALSEI